jgi:hypothetical protein
MTSAVRDLRANDLLSPGDLVHYRWWCSRTNDWITDCVPHLFLERLEGQTALVLMDGSKHRVAEMLLKRADLPCTFFAAVL